MKKPMNLVAIIVELIFLKWQTWQHFFDVKFHQNAKNEN
jgi:hypothetical protein